MTITARFLFRTAGILLVCGLGFSSPAQAQFSLVGSASQNTNGGIQLTNGFGQAGAAWFNTPLSTSQSFSETFSFTLQSLGQYHALPYLQADGITFALQNIGTGALGANGGNLGYNGLNGIGSIVQTYTNNHVGLNLDGNASHTSFNTHEWMGLRQLVSGTETVSYNAQSNLLSLQASIDGYQFNRTANINLAQKFGPTMIAGFTGATGGDESLQTITHFSPIASVPEPGNLSLLLAGMALIGVIARQRRS